MVISLENPKYGRGDSFSMIKFEMQELPSDDKNQMLQMISMLEMELILKVYVVYIIRFISQSYNKDTRN